jgi:hypothetical protein
MNSLLAGVLATAVSVTVVGSTTLAQQAGGGRRGPVPDTISVALPENGAVHFNPNGAFAVTAPGFVGTGFTGAGATTISPRTTDNPAVSIDPSLADFAAELFNNTRFCLTLNGIHCEPGTPPSGAFNYVSTRVDVRWLAQQIASDINETCCFRAWF